MEVKNRETQGNKPGSPSPEVSHLDETLTQFATRAIDKARKWRSLAIWIILLGLLAFGASTLVRQLSDSQLESLNARLSQLTTSIAAQKEDYLPNQGEVDRLLEDCKGKKAEGYVLRSLADFYMAQADKLSQKSKSGAASDPLQAANPVTSSGPSTEVVAAWDQAARIAQEAAKRLPEDAELKAWASKIQARIEGEKNKGWLPKGWKFSLQPPKDVPPQGSGQPPQAGAAEAGASSPAVKAPETPQPATTDAPAK